MAVTMDTVTWVGEMGQCVMPLESGRSQNCSAKVLCQLTSFTCPAGDHWRVTWWSDHSWSLVLVLVPPGDPLVLAAAAETSCGHPPVMEATLRLWDGSSSPGSTAFYLCEEGFYEAGGQNQSVCGEDAHWTRPSLSCRGNSAN